MKKLKEPSFKELKHINGSNSYMKINHSDLVNRNECQSMKVVKSQ